MPKNKLIIFLLVYFSACIIIVSSFASDSKPVLEFCRDGGAGGYPFSDDLSTPGAGKFIFKDGKGDPDRWVSVWYYLPENLPENHQIIFVMHGGARNGAGYRYPWIDYAIEHQFLLIAPEFSREYFPDNYHYNYGNVATRQKEPIDEKLWTFSTIEHLFDLLKTELKFSRNTYSIYGHSAGGQFVHRMVQLKPDARIDRAVAANSGWYTLPVFEKKFPEGLGKSHIMTNHQTQFFKTRLYVLLGDLDTDPKGAGLPTSSMARAQGKHRFERGHTFYNTAEKEAGRRGIHLAWQLRIAKGVGHSHLEIASHVVPLIVETSNLKK